MYNFVLFLKRTKYYSMVTREGPVYKSWRCPIPTNDKVSSGMAQDLELPPSTLREVAAGTQRAYPCCKAVKKSMKNT